MVDKSDKDSMCSGGSQFSRKSKQPNTHQTQRLYINTWAPALLHVGNNILIMADGNCGPRQCSNDLRFMAREVERYVIELKYRDEEDVVISVYAGPNFSAQMKIENGRMYFDDTYEAEGNFVTQRMRLTRPIHEKYTLKLEVKGLGFITRVDWKSNESAWFASFLGNQRLWTVRTNGDWLADQLDKYRSNIVAECNRRPVDTTKKAAA